MRVRKSGLSMKVVKFADEPAMSSTAAWAEGDCAYFTIFDECPHFRIYIT